MKKQKLVYYYFARYHSKLICVDFIQRKFSLF